VVRFCGKSFVLSMLLFAVLVYIALYVHDTFIRPFVGDVLVVLWLFYLLQSFINIAYLKLATYVLCFAYIIESAQYFNVISWFHLEHIEVIKVVFGATFDWLDLLAYTLGWLIILLINIFQSTHKLKQ
jgi:hypothetical protein